jgi:hypothetical protein
LIGKSYKTATKPTFEWAAGSGASKYELWLDDDGDFEEKLESFAYW